MLFIRPGFTEAFLKEESRRKRRVAIPRPSGPGVTRRRCCLVYTLEVPTVTVMVFKVRGVDLEDFNVQ